MQKQVQQKENENCKNKQINYDTLDISDAGRNILEQKISGLRARNIDKIGHISSVNAIGMQNDFEKALSALSSHETGGMFTENYQQKQVATLKGRFEAEDGERSDSFEKYVNKMASVYQMMKSSIEEKYADTNSETEYYIAKDGSTRKLSREKELDMLNKAYENHSRLMATSTGIWDSLRNQEFGATSSSKDETDVESEKSTKVGNAEKAAYAAFMSAISSENADLLAEGKGSLNHFKLNLNISGNDRNLLNDIWNYYANKK